MSLEVKVTKSTSRPRVPSRSALTSGVIPEKCEGWNRHPPSERRVVTDAPLPNCIPVETNTLIQGAIGDELYFEFDPFPVSRTEIGVKGPWSCVDVKLCHVSRRSPEALPHICNGTLLESLDFEKFWLKR